MLGWLSEASSFASRSGARPAFSLSRSAGGRAYARGGAVKTEAVGAAPDAMRELTEALLQQAKDRAKGA